MFLNHIISHNRKCGPYKIGFKRSQNSFPKTMLVAMVDVSFNPTMSMFSFKGRNWKWSFQLLHVGRICINPFPNIYLFPILLSTRLRSANGGRFIRIKHNIEVLPFCWWPRWNIFTVLEQGSAVGRGGVNFFWKYCKSIFSVFI